MKFKPLSERIFNDIRHLKQSHGIVFDNDKDAQHFTSDQLTEMYYGFYKNKNLLLSDSDYFINLNDVQSSYCILQQLTYANKPTLEDFKTDRHDVISNIKTFYIKSYFLVTNDIKQFGTDHEITRSLLKAGAYKRGSANFRELYKISNKSGNLQAFKQGLFPTALFHPIQNAINKFFFEDECRISDFYVASKFNIKSR